MVRTRPYLLTPVPANCFTESGARPGPRPGTAGETRPGPPESDAGEGRKRIAPPPPPRRPAGGGPNEGDGDADCRSDGSGRGGCGSVHDDRHDRPGLDDSALPSPGAAAPGADVP